MKNKNSTDTLFYKITQYIYSFLIVNLSFLFSNILLFICLIFVQISLSNILIYGIALIPTGASLQALFYTMGKFYREKTINPFFDYWKSYGANFTQSTKYWIVKLSIIIILLVDILFVLDRGWTLLSIISIIVFILLLISIIYGFSILSRFDVTTKNLLTFSIYVLFRFKMKTVSNFSFLAAFGIILYGFPSYAILCIFSIGAYYFMRNNQVVLDELQKQFREGEEDKDD